MFGGIMAEVIHAQWRRVFFQAIRLHGFLGRC
jgi:hypothetical protein